MTAEVREVCREADDAVTLHRDVAAVLQPAVGYDRWCGLVLDPATLMTTSGYHRDGLPGHLVPRLLQLEAEDNDVNGMSALARSPVGVSTLDRATGGRPESSERYRDVLVPGGLGRELRAVLRERATGWGGLVLYRETAAPDFTDEQVALVADVSEIIARAIRRCLLRSELAHRDGDGVPGMLLVGAGGMTTEVRTAAASRWLASLEEEQVADDLPWTVATLVARARLDEDGVARTRVRARAGQWLSLYAETLGASPKPPVSVVIEPSRPFELAAIMADAYLLTGRERDVAQQVLLGRSTQEIASTLFVSKWTVQDHLKSVFAKVGVRSRSELTARLFFGYYEPRMLAERPIGADGWFIDAG